MTKIRTIEPRSLDNVTESDIILPLGEKEILGEHAGLTETGYTVIKFEDYYEHDCRLQQSSLAHFNPPGSSAIWLGRQGVDMHLSLAQVKSLMMHLQNWIDTGNF